MTDNAPWDDILSADPRYKLEAYLFVQEASSYAQQVLGMGRRAKSAHSGTHHARHITAQQLCEAARKYALERFGLMSRLVLKQWGIESTGDIGEIVYNLIKFKEMTKSEEDRREDFDDVYDFADAFEQSFEITWPRKDP